MAQNMLKKDGINLKIKKKKRDKRYIFAFIKLSVV